MRVRIAAPFAQRDLPALARGLDQLVTLNPRPDKWHSWTRYARDAAETARAGKLPVLACVNCHKVYRAEYNATYRPRPIE